MKNSVIVVVCALVLVASSICSPATSLTTHRLHVARYADNPKLCEDCVDFAARTISELLQIIADVGVAGGCQKVCGLLPNVVEQDTCKVLCDLVGIDAFVKALKDAGFDSIYYCQLLRICPVDDCDGSQSHPCASVQRVTSNPEKGLSGTLFNITAFFTIDNTTGTGEILVVTTPPYKATPIESGEVLSDGFMPGTYQLNYVLDTSPTSTQPFSNGVYKIQVDLCEGMCYSQKPNSKLLATGNGNFIISNQNNNRRN